jgi:hypothetical protein
MDNINPAWESMYKQDFYSRERIIRAVSMIRDKIAPGDVVIDLGAFQQFAKGLLPSSCKYLPYDSYTYKDNILSDFDSPIELPPAKFVLCLETLEHLKHPRLLVDSVAKSLYHDGLAVFSLPNESTILHRLRGVLGVMDMECFHSEGKHLHLPSLKQCRTFLSTHFQVVDEKYYISPSAVGSRSKILGNILSLIPDRVHYYLASLCPSLFARGFIFLCKHKSSTSD